MSSPERPRLDAELRAAPRGEAPVTGDGPGRVLSVHFGRSANCSSVGSVVDVLFVSATAGTAILAGLALYLAGRQSTPEREPEPRQADDATDAAEAGPVNEAAAEDGEGAPRATEREPGERAP